MEPRIPEVTPQDDLFRPLAARESDLAATPAGAVVTAHRPGGVEYGVRGLLRRLGGGTAAEGDPFDGLLYLKHTYSRSDEALVERWVENPYWQAFAGWSISSMNRRSIPAA